MVSASTHSLMKMPATCPIIMRATEQEVSGQPSTPTPHPDRSHTEDTGGRAGVSRPRMPGRSGQPSAPAQHTDRSHERGSQEFLLRHMLHHGQHFGRRIHTHPTEHATCGPDGHAHAITHLDRPIWHSNASSEFATVRERTVANWRKEIAVSKESSDHSESIAGRTFRRRDRHAVPADSVRWRSECLRSTPTRLSSSSF
jgi:hypothetical protein